MELFKENIAQALCIDVDDLSVKDMATALLHIETTLDSVAETLENDFEEAVLGDASNLVQMIRELLNDSGSEES